MVGTDSEPGSPSRSDPWRAGTLALEELPPLSLYVHMPWCLRKCPYCDFNSHEVRLTGMAAPDAPGAGPRTFDTAEGAALQARYLQALQSDLEQALPLVWGRRVGSVFLGGGTPSLFPPSSIDALLGTVRARLPLEPNCEITLEANPGTFERERFKAYREAGVTRLSIGVQSFDDDALRRLGRVHDGEQARAAVAEAERVFETFNIDLMYALPGQDLAALRDDMAAALAYAPPHLSVYHLTLEPNTVFAQRPPAGLPDDDLAAQMLDDIIDMAGAAGLQRYEVSAFARASHRCRHNLNYWRFGDYLGIGAGAHSKISFAHRVLRQVRWRDPATYVQQALQGLPVSNEHDIARRDLPFEFALNALRLREGFSLQDYVRRTGMPPSSLEAPLDKARARGLIDRVEGETPAAQRVVPTARGFDFLSELQALFLPDVA